MGIRIIITISLDQLHGPHDPFFVIGSQPHGQTRRVVGMDVVVVHGFLRSWVCDVLLLLACLLAAQFPAPCPALPSHPSPPALHPTFTVQLLAPGLHAGDILTGGVCILFFEASGKVLYHPPTNQLSGRVCSLSLWYCTGNFLLHWTIP